MLKGSSKALKEVNYMGCVKCCKVGGTLFLAAGLLFLLQDLNVWTFWGLNWWTVAFLLVGLAKVGMAHCKDCMKRK